MQGKDRKFLREIDLYYTDSPQPEVTHNIQNERTDHLRQMQLQVHDLYKSPRRAPAASPTSPSGLEKREVDSSCANSDSGRGASEEGETTHDMSNDSQFGALRSLHNFRCIMHSSKTSLEKYKSLILFKCIQSNLTIEISFQVALHIRSASSK